MNNKIDVTIGDMKIIVEQAIYTEGYNVGREEGIKMGMVQRNVTGFAIAAALGLIPNVVLLLYQLGVFK